MTTQDRNTGHPDLERLAAYAEASIDRSGRAEIESHLADCSRCRSIVADATEFVAAEPAPKRNRMVWATTALAAAAVLVLVVRWPGDEPGIQDLVAAFASESTRPAEGRLSGGFAYAPPPPQRRGGGELERSPDVRTVVARLEIAATDNRSVATLWAAGIARLAVGDVDGAIAFLDEALRAEPTGSALHSDLAAAYFARARRSGDMADFNRALAAADRALALEPDRPEALFNRALALDVLQRDGAAAAWQALIDREAGSAWAREASAHLTPAR